MQATDLDLSWFLMDDIREVALKDGVKVVSGHLISGINTTLHIIRRDTWAKLQEKDKLVVASYAFDGMSFVGNAYWSSSLCSSSDPAAIDHYSV